MKPILIGDALVAPMLDVAAHEGDGHAKAVTTDSGSQNRRLRFLT